MMPQTRTCHTKSISSLSLLLLLLVAPFTVHASLGNMGFTKLKRIPGGFNAKQLPSSASGQLVVRKTSSSNPTTTTIALPNQAQLDGSATSSVPKSGTTVFVSPAASNKPTAAQLFFDEKPQILYQSIVLGSNLVGFLVSSFFAKKQFFYHVDLLGTGAFCFGALPAFFMSSKAVVASSSTRTKATTTTKPVLRVSSSLKRIRWTSAAVVAWSAKLTSYLVWRMKQRTQPDPQLSAIMENPNYCAGFWAFSTLWGLICGLPYSMGLTSSIPGDDHPLFATGMSMFAAGCIVETLADYQKQKHRLVSDAFLNEGLWSLSQHPNWFGNILLWSGLWVANIPALVEPLPKQKDPPTLWQRLWSCRRVVVAALGPLFMLRLFEQQATGVMNGSNLERARAKYGYGSDPEYTKYVDDTPLIFPFGKMQHDW